MAPIDVINNAFIASLKRCLAEALNSAIVSCYHRGGDIPSCNAVCIFDLNPFEVKSDVAYPAQHVRRFMKFLDVRCSCEF